MHIPVSAQGEGYSEEELPNSLVDELEERVSPEQRHFAAFQARVSSRNHLVSMCCRRSSATLRPFRRG